MDGGAWWAAVHGVPKSRTRLSDFTYHFSLSCIGEGNDNPLQCSCLENPRDGGAWWAAVYGVAQNRTWLKRLSSSSSRKWLHNFSLFLSMCTEHTKCVATSYRVVIVDSLTISCWTFKSEWEGPLGGPVAKTPHSRCGKPGFHPWSGNWCHVPQLKIPRAPQLKTEKDLRGLSEDRRPCMTQVRPAQTNK